MDAPLDVINLLRLLGNLKKPSHRHGRIRHAVRETPLIVIPCQNPHHVAIQHFCLIKVKDRRARVMVEITRHIRLKS